MGQGGFPGLQGPPSWLAASEAEATLMRGLQGAPLVPVHGPTEEERGRRGGLQMGGAMHEVDYKWEVQCMRWITNGRCNA